MRIATAVAALAVVALAPGCAGTDDAARHVHAPAAPARDAATSGDAAATWPGHDAAPPGDPTVTGWRDAAPASGPGDLPPPDPRCPTPPKGLVVGTWTPRDGAGFDEQSWLDEANLREVYTKERAGRRIWRGFGCTSSALPIDTLLDDREGPAIGYAYVLVQRSGLHGWPDVPAVLHVRHRGRIQARFDGALVVDAPAPPPGTWGEARAPVELTDAFDVLLLKLGRGSPELGESMDVEVRLSAPDGSPLPDQAWNTMRPPSLPSEL